MRSYPKVGGQKGKPGYRTPRSFLQKFVKMTSRVSRKETYNKFKNYFLKKDKK